MFNLVINIALILKLLSYSLSCRCPRGNRENITQILNDTKPFTLSPVVIGDKDFGIPFVANKLIFIPREFNYSTGKDPFTQNFCPKGYRNPNKTEIEGIITQLGADASTFFKDETKFGLKEQKYLMTKSRASDDEKSPDYNKSATWTINSAGDLEFAAIKPIRGTYAFWKCIENDASISLNFEKYIFTNQTTNLTLNEVNFPAVQWLINNDTLTNSSEIVKAHTFNISGCHVIQFWALSLNETKHYNCKVIYSSTDMGNNHNNSFNVSKIQFIDTGINTLQTTNLFFSDGSFPVAPKDDGGFYIIFNNAKTGGVQVLEYTEDYTLVASVHLGLKGGIYDANATPWGFVIYLNEGNHKSVLYGFYANFKKKFSKVIMNNGLFVQLNREQIPFYTSGKGTYFGLNAIYTPDTAKVIYGKGRIMLIHVHYSNFGSGTKVEGHTGDSAYTFDDNGEDVKLGFAWGSSHALIESLVFNGGYFFCSTLGDAYPMNIMGSILDVDKVNTFVDPVLKFQNTFASRNMLLASKEIPGNLKGNTCGRLGGSVTNGTHVATIYCVKPCRFKPAVTNNVLGFVSYYGKNGTFINKTDIPLLEGPDAATYIVQVRVGKWGDKILILILKTLHSFGMEPNPTSYGGNTVPYYMVVDFEGKILQDLTQAPKALMPSNEDLRTLRNGDLVWGAADYKTNPRTLLVAFMRSDLNSPIITPTPPPPKPTP